MQLTTIVLATLLSAQPANVPASPASAVTAALADIRRLPHERRRYTRYLSAYHLDKTQGEQWDLVLRFWVNSLSQEPELTPPVWIAPNLWRLYLDNYRWKKETWEKLLDVPEPYFHARALLEEIKERKEVRYEYKQVWTGYGYHAQLVPYNVIIRDVKEVEKIASAPWLNAGEIGELILHTQSQVPLVRADWWFFQTGIQRDRQAGYYDFLGVGQKEQDFLNLGVASFKASEKLRKLHRGTVARSGVVRFARGLKAGATLTEGVAILTEDYASTVDAKNALRLLEGDAKPDGGEGYITLPNGLFAVWIQNGEGKRVDFVPEEVATDAASPSNDRTVDAGMDCFRCHREGLRPINDWTRQVYRAPFQLEGADFETTRRLRSAYLSDLEGFVGRGNDVFSAALLRTNGLTPAQNAQAVADAWASYELGDVDMVLAARQLGVPLETWTVRLRAAASAEKKLDPVLAGLFRGAPARIEHWEEVFPQAMAIAREGR